MKHSNYKFGHGSDASHKQDQALFAKLLDHHHELKRTTVKLSNGIQALTTSDNPSLVQTLQDHVTGMEKRFASGRAIRSWDPLFAALFEYKDSLDMRYKMEPTGISVTLTSEDPKLIELIHCHDLTLHGFVDLGRAISGQESPKPSWLD